MIETQSKAVAEAMCLVGRLLHEQMKDQSILWDTFQCNLVDRDYSVTFRVGTGRSTHCRTTFILSSPIFSTITFGKKMIQSKLDASKRMDWLTGREIINRGYFNGSIDIYSLLAHTVIHEYAHFIHKARYVHAKNAVHDDRFYRILGQLHDQGYADTVKGNLAKELAAKGIDLPSMEQAAPKTEPLPAARASDFQIGDMIEVKKISDGIFKVIKVNRTTITVIRLRDGEGWRVSPGLASRLNNNVANKVLKPLKGGEVTCTPTIAHVMDAMLSHVIQNYDVDVTLDDLAEGLVVEVPRISSDKFLVVDINREGGKVTVGRIKDGEGWEVPPSDIIKRKMAEPDPIPAQFKTALSKTSQEPQANAPKTPHPTPKEPSDQYSLF